MDQREMRRHKRRNLSCEYCRMKKLKCDGAKPACKSCRNRGQDCIPQIPAQQPRPTNRRIQELEEENRHLLALLQKSKHTSHNNQEGSSDSTQAGCTTSLKCCKVAVDQEPDRGQLIGALGQEQSASFVASSPAVNISGTRTSVVAEAPQNKDSSYHGQTSVLFDQLPRTSESMIPEESSVEGIKQVRCRLVAETAKQRQLEVINFSANRLDFDGLDRTIGKELLSIYWNRQLHTGLVVYRTAFMRDMACGGPYFSKLLLNAIYYSASKHCSSTMIRQVATDRATAGWSFRERFNELLRDAFDKTKVTTIQALLIMSSSLFSRCDERSTSWLYAGNAFNMIIDSGLHVVPSVYPRRSDEDFEIRRRVFWSAFLLDKLQCLYQGRHPSLRLSDTNVPLVFADDYEDFELFSQVSFIQGGQVCASPSYQISTLEYFCKLSIIMERIHSKVYAVSHLDQDKQILFRESLSLQKELEEWRSNLPLHLYFVDPHDDGHPLPYNLAMLAIYNVLVILIHRLFISDRRLSSGSTTGEALMTCWNAANEIAHVIQVHESLYQPLSETFSLCYAAHISAVFHVHALAQHGNRHGALDSLRVCLRTLDKHQAIYLAAGRARSVLRTLITHLNVQVDNNIPSVEQSVPSNDTCYTGGQIEGSYTRHIPEPAGHTLSLEAVDWDNFQSLGDSWMDFSEYPILDLWNNQDSPNTNL